MKHSFHVFLILFMALAIKSISQQQVPFFADKKDSVLYHEVSRNLNGYFQSGKISENKATRDSLFLVQQSLIKRIAGFRYVYTAQFPTIDELAPASWATTDVISVDAGSKIPKEIFQLKNLKKLELVNTRIKRLPKNLRKLNALSQLIIYNNQIGRPLRLSKNARIESLTISSPQLPKKYAAFPNLKKLVLAKNNLTRFPDVTGLKELVTLDLKNNKLDDISDVDLEDLVKLEGLELQYNSIRVIPASFGSLPSLKKMMLNYNQVADIHPAISKLNKLEQVGLYQNKLKEIPAALLQLSSLREIDLYYNEIERVGPEIGNWKNLEILYLSNNRIVSVTEKLGELTALQELYLSNNRISSMPASINRLGHLRVFRANNNVLVEPPNYLLKLNNLENIDLSANSLTEMNINMLAGAKLKIVILKANPWDETTKNELFSKAEELRQKGVVVHLEGISPTEGNGTIEVKEY